MDLMIPTAVIRAAADPHLLRIPATHEFSLTMGGVKG